VRASEWEFRHRFWVISAIFFVTFACYNLDHLNLAEALTRRLVPAPEIDGPRGRLVLQSIFTGAAAITLAAAWLRSWASAYLSSAVVHDTRLHADRLVADGPFRYVRNPLYLGNVLLSIGMGFLASRLGAVVLIVAHTFFLLRLIRREEEALAATGRESFERYRAAVPSLVPSLTPRVPASGVAPRWGQGILGEAFFWIIALSMVVFALTLESRVLPIATAIGFVIYWALFAVWKRRDRSSRPAE
jgi:protein-S-isoprenylcysteine O-methyltransferase Ste14